MGSVACAGLETGAWSQLVSIPYMSETWRGIQILPCNPCLPLRGATAARIQPRINSRQDLFSESRKPSVHSELMMAEQQRRLSEAGVNRRPSAAQVLTEDTSSFMIG